MSDFRYINKVTGTGASITVKPGFKASYVNLMNPSGVCIVEWTQDMASGSGIKQTNGALAYIGSGGVTIGADELTFTIGADADLNALGEPICMLVV